MKHEQLNNKNSIPSFSNGISYSVGASVLLTLIIATVVFLLMIINGTAFYEAIFSYLSSVVFFGLIICIITFLCVLFIGAPTAIILTKLNLESEVIAAFVGLFSVQLILTIMLGEGFEWQFLYFYAYGAVCGYAFMFGYKKDNKS